MVGGREGLSLRLNGSCDPRSDSLFVSSLAAQTAFFLLTLGRAYGAR